MLKWTYVHILFFHFIIIEKKFKEDEIQLFDYWS